LHDLGFNLNFAPVVDINLTEEAGIIGRLARSFSTDPKEVTRLARRFVTIYHQEKMICSYKHFPGHGSASGDTHIGFVDVSDSWQASELEPYRYLESQDSQKMMIMTAHVINRHLDASGLPASLSHTMLTRILRQELGFDGVIISDDLQMQAIANHYSLEESLALTLNAGADMLIFGNQLGDISAVKVIDCIEHLVLDKVVPSSRIDEAYQRIARLKGVGI
jgi:beta-N-acetylhexosaminidase